MAIKQGGTTVISNTREFTNLTGVQGEYDNIQPELATRSAGSGTLNPSMAAGALEALTLTGGSVTIGGISSTTGGDQFTYMVDTSTDLHDLTFGDGKTWLFENDSEPDWTTARYWIIVITSWDAAVHSVTATSWGA